MKDFVNSFGDEKAPNKGMFPYEAINTENFKEVLDSCQPFKQSDFDSYLNQNKISDEDYQIYLNDWNSKNEFGEPNYFNRWCYLQHYNELDTKIMISPIDNIIKLNQKYHVDALLSLSLSYNAPCLQGQLWLCQRRQ